MKEHTFWGWVLSRLEEGVEGAGRCLFGRGWVLSGGVLSGGKGKLYVTGSDIIPPPCGKTNGCKNIPFPQTSFAGGNKTVLNVQFEQLSSFRKTIKLTAPL